MIPNHDGLCVLLCYRIHNGVKNIFSICVLLGLPTLLKMILDYGFDRVFGGDCSQIEHCTDNEGVE